MPTETQPSFPPSVPSGPPPVTVVDFAIMMQLHRQIDARIEHLEQVLMQVANNQTNSAQKVMVNDISMSFSAMVWFMVKWAIASIPATIILTMILIIVGWFVLLFFGAMLVALLR